MSLVWKLLRQHISVPQLLGFVSANLFGMCILLLGYQFYSDIMPVFTAEDSFLKTDFVILSKKIGTGSAFSGRAGTFSRAEYEDLEAQGFATKLGRFTSIGYRADGRMGINGMSVLNTELFFESIPDDFVDVSSKDFAKDWKYAEGSKEVPVLLPRTYLTMYNFGFAQGRSLPKISDGLVGMIDFDIFIQGNGHHESFKGRVIGFSNRLSTILVPQAFMDWSNGYFAPESHADPTRLVMRISNPGAENVTEYLDRKGYEVEEGQLEAEKATYFLKLVVTLVMMVGLVISVLSFYILMLSVYLLVQKNSSKLETLLLIGYSPGQVAGPYQWITIGLNAVVLLVAWAALALIRSYYMDRIGTLFPEVGGGTLMPAIMLGLAMFVLVSVCNVMAVSHKIRNVWKRKE